MRVHVVRHVPFEGPALIAEWAAERGHELSESMGVTSEFPPVDDVDFLVVMGGPMAADDDAGNPWLASEKRFIAETIAQGRSVLGVCLGAQLLAVAIGGTVRRNAYREIGWYPVRRTAAGGEDPAFWAFPEVLVAGHWHGDTFDLPEGVMPTLSSDATANQAFSANGGRVVGLQFHLEWTREALEALVDACIDEFDEGGPYVSTAPDILADWERHASASRAALWKLLDAMAMAAEVGLEQRKREA